MKLTNISTDYRPLRIGFLVDADDIKGVSSSAGVNTLLWGGIYNPIIPVLPDDDTQAKELISIFEVDILKAVQPSEQIESVVNQYPYLREIDGRFDELFYESGRRNKKELRFLDSLNIVDFYWHRDIKHQPDQEKNPFALVRWDVQDPLSTLYELQFGYFPQDHLLINHKTSFLKGLRSHTFDIAPRDELNPAVLKIIDPITLTRAELYPYDRVMDSGIYLGDPHDFNDLVTFWNLRAAGCRLLFLPKDDLFRYEKVARLYIADLENQHSRSPNIEDPIVIYHRDRTDEEIRQIREMFSSSKQMPSSDLQKKQVQRVCHYHFQPDQASAYVEQQGPSYQVTVELPEKKFIVDDYLSHRRQHFAISFSMLEGKNYYYPNHTLTVPNIRDLNDFYSREIGLFDPGGLRAEKNGFAKLIWTTDDRIFLNPIPFGTLIRRLFQHAGIKTEVSQPGRLANRIIEMFGDIDGARVLKIPGVRKILQDSKHDTLFTRSGAKQIIRETGDFIQHEDLYIEPRESPKLKPDEVFDFLLKKEILRAGLELRCELCHLQNWRSLDAIGDRWSCEYCGAQGLTSLQLRHRGDWKFRKSGLFSRDNNQEGAIPVILTLYAFLRVLEFGSFVYSTALELDSPRCEVDFCVLQYTRGSRIEIAIGECKSSGGTINQDDVDNQRLVWEKFNKAGFDCYMTFSKTADSFTDEELNLFNKIVDDGLPVVLLLNRELEPYHPYAFNKKVSQMSYGTIGGMAEKSMQIYLEKPFISPTRFID